MANNNMIVYIVLVLLLITPMLIVSGCDGWDPEHPLGDDPVADYRVNMTTGKTDTLLYNKSYPEVRDLYYTNQTGSSVRAQGIYFIWDNQSQDFVAIYEDEIAKRFGPPKPNADGNGPGSWP